MAPDAPKTIYDIEPFDPANHNRTAFSCGVERLDNYLKRTAKKHQAGDFARVFVAVEPGSPAVIGYYSINAHSIEGDGLPRALTKNNPRHGAVPAAYLSMLAADQRAQGKGLGRILLADALKRLIPVSEEMGLAVVVLDVFDDDGADAYQRRITFYERMGFQSLPSNRARMFITMKDVRAAFVEQDA